MRSTFPILVLLCTSIVCLFAQGSLTPSGAPGPTMKSLTDIDAKLEPRTPIPGGIVNTIFSITRPGSYYLTGNRTNTAAGSTAISVLAHDVVIDLNGFTLSGAGVAQSGISATSRTNLAVLNGTVSDFTSVAISASFSGTGHTISRVSVLNNGGIAIALGVTTACRVVDCLVAGNFGGISVGNGSIVAQNRVISGGGTQYGISGRGNCLITDNAITSWDTNAVHAWGITVTGNGCRIIGNTVAYTSVVGIQTLGQSIIKGNHISHSNLGTNALSGGISVFNEAAEIEDNVIYSCFGAGIALYSTRSSAINNRIKACDVGIQFGAGNCYFANNRVSGATNAFSGTVPAGALNAGGNISF